MFYGGVDSLKLLNEYIVSDITVRWCMSGVLKSLKVFLGGSMVTSTRNPKP